MEFKLTPDLMVGYPKIDEQHKELIDRINALNKAMANRAGKEEVGKIIDFLDEYVIFHFNAEEKLMEQYKYPEISFQKTEHRNLISSVKKFKKDFETQGASATLVIQTHKFLSDWLINHIKKMDAKLGAFLSKAK
ncbi:MAG: bacteriohemerythrin [Firmicutes bacterium]|nr:bacteriohemerythrin [Bacillota bacterium]